MNVSVFRFPMNSPSDSSALEDAINSGQLDPTKIICGIGKTEGNGGANDFTRQLATISVLNVLGSHLGGIENAASQVTLAWSGGTEGVLSPHITLFARDMGITSTTRDHGNRKRLAISVQNTRTLAPEEIGRMAEVKLVADATRRAMEECGITDPSDVHLVIVKGPLLTPIMIEDAIKRQQLVVTRDPNQSKVFARAATALGVAVALGEVDMSAIHDDDIGTNMNLYSNVAMTSAGSEIQHCEIILVANSEHSTSAYRIGHGEMGDPIDIYGILNTLRSSGLSFNCLPSSDQQARIAAVFAKAEAPKHNYIRGLRHTMLSDADINYERHARAAVGAVLASIIGNTAIFVSGGTEHQAPLDHAPLAVIVKVD